MQGTINHQLDNGRLISLPVPAHGVTFAVVETSEMVCVFFGLKTPGVMSARDILERSKKAAPGLPWKIYLCAETGSPGGSPHPFEQYRLKKEENRLVLDVDGVGDMVTAFQNVGSEQSPSAVAIAGEDLEAILAGLTGDVKQP
jgi:hypothetical protein